MRVRTPIITAMGLPSRAGWGPLPEVPTGRGPGARRPEEIPGRRCSDAGAPCVAARPFCAPGVQALQGPVHYWLPEVIRARRTYLWLVRRARAPRKARSPEILPSPPPQHPK